MLKGGLYLTMMSKFELEQLGIRFRQAIQRARDNGEFRPVRWNKECMNEFPDDCCDDASIMFGNYLFENCMGQPSDLVTGHHFDESLGFSRGHTWLVVNNFVVDLTGDQFKNDPQYKNFNIEVHVGAETAMHKVFNERRRTVHCYPINYRIDDRELMQSKYDRVMKYFA